MGKHAEFYWTQCLGEREYLLQSIFNVLLRGGDQMKLRFLCLAGLVLATMAGQVQAGGVIITYKDVGSDLQFNYSGSLNVATGFTFVQNYSTVSVQGGSSPLFYSASAEGYAATDFTVTHTAGSFATNLPTFSPVQGTRSGTSFLFRLNNGATGPATSVDLWGDWGAANTLINGQLTLTGQSAASIGMVDGWSLQTDWGSITFQKASAVPEPASIAMWSLGGLAVMIARRKRQQTTMVA